MYKNETEWGTKNELRNIENDHGQAKTIQVSRITGLIQPITIEG